MLLAWHSFAQLLHIQDAGLVSKLVCEAVSLASRHCLQITAPATPSELAAAKTQTLTYNATICQAMLRALGAATGLTELGNGICNGGPFNTAVCGWDRVSTPQ